MRTFEDITQEELHFRKVQLNQYSHAYHLTALCPVESREAAVNRSVITRAILEAEEDADVHFTRMTGSVIAPVDSNGQWVGTDIGLDGAFLPAGVDSGRMTGGLSMSIANHSTGVTLTSRYQDPQVGATLLNDFIPVELMLTPGYGFTFYKPYPFDYFLPRNQKMLFLFRNRDRQGAAGEVQDSDYFHRITICLIGQRIER
jgi:hypothetical protein